MDKQNALMLLRTALDDPVAEFHHGQWEAIDGLVNYRRKLIVVERTGWGKSLVYFIGTRLLRDHAAGPTIIVSPLLALMRNQIESAQRLGVRAATINSSNRDRWDQVKQQIRADRIDALLISPERLANDAFVEDVLLPIANRVGLFVVDEVHCISDWGHDFRPDYRRLIGVLRQMPPNTPVLGTTATANDRVIKDINDLLGDVDVQRGALVRPSLCLQAVRMPDQGARLAWLAQNVPALPGTGIVYVLTVRDAEIVASWLNQQGISAHAYYSGATKDGFANSDEYRRFLEERLLENDMKALVATTALGMGYDKPDIGFVIHYQAPGSVVAYYQQVGRAGRAIDSAYGILLSGREDDDIHEYFRRTAFPREEEVNLILRVLGSSDGLTMHELQRRVNMRQGQIEKVLKLLSLESPAPVIKEGQHWKRTAVSFRMDRERMRHLTRQREEEWQEVLDYINTRGCLMAYLQKTLNDPHAAECGRCANCMGKPVVAAEFDHALAVSAYRFLRHNEFPIKPRKKIPVGALEKFEFPRNLPADLRASEGRVLSRWNDAGWGIQVAEDKQNGRFRDDLVEAITDMYRHRWRPEPAAEWVVCVPSQRHPELVPDFARRLAQRLELPFVDAIHKIRENQPQKMQENSFHQCRNLDGAFSVPCSVPDSPVLLVDDIMDSGWTVTILAVLLHRAGSGPVYPVALASTSTGG